jgi:hypothetical protein
VAGHIGLCAGFVDEDEMLRVQLALMTAEKIQSRKSCE